MCVCVCVLVWEMDSDESNHCCDHFLLCVCTKYTDLQQQHSNLNLLIFTHLTKHRSWMSDPVRLNSLKFNWTMTPVTLPSCTCSEISTQVKNACKFPITDTCTLISEPQLWECKYMKPADGRLRQRLDEPGESGGTKQCDPELCLQRC